MLPAFLYLIPAWGFIFKLPTLIMELFLGTRITWLFV